MKRSLRDKMFIILLFGMIYVVLSYNVSVTGHSVAVPSLDDFVPAKESFTTGIITADDDAKDVFLALGEKINFNVAGLMPGSIIHVRDGENTYGITVLHVVQDYARGDEYVNVFIEPGSRRIRLQEGDEYIIDFNNDGRDDAVLAVKAVHRGGASLQLRSP